jgi:hypothetical protein
MAFGVDAYPNPPEEPEGHYEWDVDDEGPVRRWIAHPEKCDLDPDALVDDC